MKYIFQFIFFVFICSISTTKAQISISSLGAPTQTFDAMGSGNALPVNWRMSVAGSGTSTLSWADATNVTTTSFAASSGTPTTGGRYNWGTTAGTDRAIGFMTDAAYATPNAILAWYRNSSGSTLNSISVSFNIERYKIDASTCAVYFYTSLDGNNWTYQPQVDVGTDVFSPGAVSYTFTTPATVVRSKTFNNLNLASSGDIYLKWVFVNTGSTTAQGLGLDNVAVTVNTPAITANLGDILSDLNSNGQANPGEIITYKDTIKNSSSNADGLSVVIADTTAPTGSTKVVASTKTSAVAVNDNYSTGYNTQLTGQNVLLNDFGLPSPQVLTYGTTTSGGLTTTTGNNGTTNKGGTVVITSNGILTYTPPTNFSGLDSFKYVAGTGVGLPDNDAVVIILVNQSAPSFTSSHTDPLCNGNSNGSITITASGGSGTYLYSKNNGTNYQTSNVFNGLAAGPYNQLLVKDAITGSLSATGSETLTNPATVTFTFTKTDITCNNANNGTITFNTTTGGSNPYTYSITGTGGTFQSSTSFTNLSANNYTLVVKDNNGCLSATSSSTVVNPPVITVSGSVPQLIYNTAMSTATFTKSGGTGTLTFSKTGTLPNGLTFNSGAGTITGTPTQTGIFPVTIIATDANNCTGNLSISISVAPNLTAKSYTDVGNTQLNGGVAAPATPSVSVASIANGNTSDAIITYLVVSGPTHGTLTTFNNDGTFLYTPNAGNTTSDLFTYSGTSNGVTSQQTATINFNGMVWYVDNATAASTNDGRSNTPFKTLAAANSASTANGDYIYVYKGSSSTTGAYTMKTSQKLIGAGATLNVGSGLLIIAGNTANTPTLSGTVTLASSVTVDGIDMNTGTLNAITGSSITGVAVTARNVTTTTGTAVTIAGSGNTGTYSFTSVSANGATNGISITNLTSGSFTVNGDGTNTSNGGNSSGGTIQNMAGTDGTAAGSGVYLSNATNVTLRRMTITGTNQNFGIYGTSVVGFTMEYSTVSGTNGTNASAPYNEGSVSFSNLTGTAAVTSCNISGGFSDNFRVVNTTGTLNRITFTSVSIGANSTSNGNDGITIEGQGTTVVNVTVQNSFFTSARGDLFQLNLLGTSSSDLIFTGNALSNNHPAIATGGGGVTISGGDNSGTGSNLTYNISNNTFKDANGHAILIVKSTDPGTFSGSFTNNTIGISGTANSGSVAGSGLKLQNAGLGSVAAIISANHIYQYNNFGLELETGGGATAMSGSLNSTITGNTISNPGTSGLPMNGIQLNCGTVPNDTYIACVNIGGAGILANSVTGSGANGGTDIRLRQRQNTTVNLPGYGGSASDNTAVESYLSGRNGGCTTLSSNTIGSGGNGFIHSAAICN